MKVLAVLALLCVLSTSVATQPAYYRIGCRVIGVDRQAITCAPINDTSQGLIFTVWYTGHTRAQTVPRWGRAIVIYYAKQDGYMLLDDWFRWRG